MRYKVMVALGCLILSLSFAGCQNKGGGGGKPSSKQSAKPFKASSDQLASHPKNVTGGDNKVSFTFSQNEINETFPYLKKKDCKTKQTQNSFNALYRKNFYQVNFTDKADYILYVMKDGSAGWICKDANPELIPMNNQKTLQRFLKVLNAHKQKGVTNADS